MVSVKRTFKDRANEINLYYAFTDKYIRDSKDEDLNKILKSNLILMLYNLVESSISNAIQEIHNNIHTSQVSFDTLKVRLKEVIIKYLKNRGPQKFVSSINDIAIDIVKRSFDKEQVFNGNVDRDQINELSILYGFNSNTTYLRTKHGEALKAIKVKRNDLAHGTFSFVEVGKEYTIEDLERMKDETINYLDEIISNIESYLVNKEYMQVAGGGIISTISNTI